MVDGNVGEPVCLRFGQFAVADIVDRVEQFGAHLLIGLLPADDGGEVDEEVAEFPDGWVGRNAGRQVTTLSFGSINSALIVIVESPLSTFRVTKS